MNKNFRTVFLVLFSCLCIAFTAVFMTGCGTINDNTDEITDNNKGEEELVEVVRAVDEIEFGEEYTNEKLAVVKVSKNAVPDGAVSNVDELKNKYASVKLFAGDYVTAAKVLDSKPENIPDEDDDVEEIVIDPYELGYVVITKYDSYKDGNNYSPAIKKAIEENPGRTIYFPDGTYNISEPIVISADPEKSVALRLSHLAVICAVDWGADPSVAMIRIGVEDGDKSSSENLNFSSQRSTFIMGGNIYGNSMASGISIEGGKDILIYNVSLKRVYNGIHILYGNNATGAVYANVDNVNITGYEATGSAGILVEGTRNTFSNMRIASVQYGVLCTETGEGNVFRNLHPLTVAMNDRITVDENGKRNNDARHTVGFYDKSKGNNFDVCYSDQFASGYLFEEQCRSVVISGFCYWWTTANNYQVGFESTGKFNAVVVCPKVTLPSGSDMITYLYIGDTGGQGVVLYPEGNTDNKFSYMLDSHLKQ